MFKKIVGVALLSLMLQSVALASNGADFAKVYQTIKVNKSLVPENYPSKEAFANFREVVAASLKPKTFYRTSHPMDIHGNKVRHNHADKLAQAAGIKVEIDLTDDDNDIVKMVKSKPVQKKYCYKEIYQKGMLFNTYLDGEGRLSSDWPKIAKAFRFMLKNDGPYLVHCTLGRDRAGLFSMLTAALAGATLEELRKDYMLTYCNYYHVQPGTYDYSIIERYKCDRLLYYIAHPECAEDKQDIPDKVNVYSIKPEEAAKNFFKIALGFSDEEIAALQKKLKA